MRRARTRRERRAREKRSAQIRRLGAISAIVGVIVAAGGLPGVLVWRELTKPEMIIDESGCSPTDRPLHVVVLIDQTDDLDPQWEGFVKGLAPALVKGDRLPEFGRLTVFGLTDDRTAPLELWLSECKPPEENGSFLFDSRADRVATQSRLAAFYEDKIADVAARFETNAGRDASPILEGVVALGDFVQGINIDRRAEETRVIVVSDMLQFTRASPRITHYGANAPDFDAFYAAPTGRALTALLDVEQVIVHYVRRNGDEDHQSDGHMAFWSDYFQAAGVDVLTWNDDPLAAMGVLGD